VIDFAYPASTGLPYLLILSQILTGIAWPLAAFIALLLFKGPITQAIGQLKEVALPGGARAQFQSAKTATEGAQPNEVLLSDVDGKSDVDKAGTNLPSYLLHNEDLLLSELAKYPEVEHKAILVRALVFERLHKHFAVVFCNIFG
jgi:hypothetical protein